MGITTFRRKPPWMKTPIGAGKNFTQVKEIIAANNLNTICTSGKCPNKGECWNAGTATFMILGDICTRSCKFCATKSGMPLPADYDEPIRIADSIEKLKLKHAVLTSVDRDDLEDSGAIIWANTIREIKKRTPHVSIEALIPDMNGVQKDIGTILEAGAEIVSHNLETVRRLTKATRSKAKYDLSLEVLKQISSSTRAKSGLMLGLGETHDEILEAMDDLRNVGVEVLTLGQYLQPTEKHLPIFEFITPEQFKEYELIGLQKGFRYVESGPLVRSSYHAEKHVI